MSSTRPAAPQRLKIAGRAAAACGGLPIGLLIVVLAGCGAGSARPPQVTVQGCADYGVRVIEQAIRVTGEPAACRGLSQVQVKQAVARSVYLVAGGHRKAVWRRLAVVAGARLSRLVAATPAAVSSGAASAAPPGSPAPVPRRRPGRDLAAGLAALVSWLAAVGSGSYLLAGWIAHGGLRGQRAAGAGLPPTVIFGHIALASTGLLVWVSYLVTAVTALAWTAVALLIPVAGLGFATLALSLPGDRSMGAPADPVPVTGHTPVARAPVARAPVARAPVARAPVTSLAPVTTGRMPVLVIAGHGLAAGLTILLVLLAALTARSG